MTPISQLKCILYMLWQHWQAPKLKDHVVKCILDFRKFDLNCMRRWRHWSSFSLTGRSTGVPFLANLLRKAWDSALELSSLMFLQEEIIKRLAENTLVYFGGTVANYVQAQPFACHDLQLMVGISPFLGWPQLFSIWSCKRCQNSTKYMII